MGRRGFELIRSPLQGTKVLRELLAAKQCLLVVDDVWSLSAAQALAVTGPAGRLLLTTRDRLLLQRLGATTIQLDVLDVDAARQLRANLTGSRLASCQLRLSASPRPLTG